MVDKLVKKDPDKSLTSKQLKDLLTLSNIKFSNKLKVEDLKILCQEHNLIKPEFKNVAAGKKMYY
jgi:hypothetical protein